MGPELEAFITQAMLEVERDLSLPANFFCGCYTITRNEGESHTKDVGGTPWSAISRNSSREAYSALERATPSQKSRSARKNHFATNKYRGVATEEQRATRGPYGCVSQTVKKLPIQQPTALLRATK